MGGVERRLWPAVFMVVVGALKSEKRACEFKLQVRSLCVEVQLTLNTLSFILFLCLCVRSTYPFLKKSILAEPPIGVRGETGEFGGKTRGDDGQT